jgi:general secretion pathway protein D
MVLGYFAAAGVNITNYGGTVFFNDRNGILFVRASMADLEIIEEAIEVLNVLPPQVSIEAKFAEVSQQDSRAMGFDTFLGNILMANGAIGGQGGTAPAFIGNSTRANPSGVFPNPPLGIPAPSALVGSTTDGQINNGVEGGGNAIATITGILTNPQFRLVIKALESRSGTDVLTAPRVITVSGRQAQLQVTDNRTIVTGLSSSQQNGGGNGGNNNNNQPGGNVGGGAVAAAITPLTQSLSTGPVLDILPHVAADGFSISMALIPSVVEFIGYDDPGPFAPLVQSVGAGTVGVPLTARLPLPRTRVRQVVTSVVVWDGQTVMLGGLISDEVTNTRNKVPFLADLPVFGKLFRTESKTTFKKNLYIFVTATIIDPAGNRVHLDSDLPIWGPPAQSAKAPSPAQ